MTAHRAPPGGAGCRYPSMRRFLILLAALGLLAGEPAVAAPVPAPDLASLDLGLLPALLSRVLETASPLR